MLCFARQSPKDLNLSVDLTSLRDVGFPRRKPAPPPP